MKTIVYKISGLLVMVLLLSSCKKSFLDIVPKGKAIATTIGDYDLLMNNTSFYSLNANNNYMIMGDDIGAEQARFQNSDLNTQRSFGWEDVIQTEGQDDVYTSVQLQNLYICNKIINEVISITDGSELQRKRLQAEALATRAWINFDLINRYGKPYKAATAAQDPGFPIITEANINAGNYTRNSIAEVYAAIIADLKMAIPNLPAKSVFVTRMSRPAATTLLGKVYLFMRQYPDALPQFNSALADLENDPSIASLYNYNDAFAETGAFRPFGFMGPDYPGSNVSKHQESILLKTQYIYPTSNGVVMSPAVMELYEPSDLRLNFYGRMRSDQSAVAGELKVKSAVQLSHLGIELSDLILMRAEVKAQLNDLTGARADVQRLRENRMPFAESAVPATLSSQTDLIKFIIDERQREYAGEGQRWLDMRRLSVDPIFEDQVSRHFIYAADGETVNRTITLRPVRLTLRIPQTILEYNPEMRDNP